jgi:PhnB protein
MKVMVIIKASKDSEAGRLPSGQLLSEMQQFNEELARAGVIRAGEGLKASSVGARVRFDGAARTVTPGPFSGTNDLIAGFWIWQVRDLEEAIDWVKRCPNPQTEPTEVEIRPVFEPDDFAASDPSGEIRTAEKDLRDRLART